MIEISEGMEEFYNKIMEEADGEWKKLSEEERKKYNIVAKEFDQTGKDYYFFKKVAKKNEEEKLKCTASKKQ